MARAVAIMVVLMLMASCGVVLAQATAETSDKVTIEMSNVDVRSAIEALFKGKNKNLSIDASVTGTVPTVSFKDVPFDAALKQLVRAAGLVYRIDGDIYIVSKRPEPNPDRSQPVATGSNVVTDYLEPTAAKETFIEKIPLYNTSASEILAMLGQSASGLAGAYSTWGGYSPNAGSYGGSNNYGGNNGGGYSSYGGGNYGGSSSGHSTNFRYGGGNSGYGGYNSGGNSNYGGYNSGGSAYRSW